MQKTSNLAIATFIYDTRTFLNRKAYILMYMQLQTSASQTVPCDQPGNAEHTTSMAVISRPTFCHLVASPVALWTLQMLRRMPETCDSYSLIPAYHARA